MVRNERERDNNAITSILPKLLDILRVVTAHATNQATDFLILEVGFRSDFDSEKIDKRATGGLPMFTMLSSDSRCL